MKPGGSRHMHAIALLIRCSSCKRCMEQDGELYRARCVVPSCRMFGRWVSKRGR